MISGYEGYFRPDDTITREEMAVVIIKAYVFRGGTTERGKIDQFSAKENVSQWALDFVDQATSVGLVSGMTSNIFAPLDNTTRAQAASILKRLLNKLS